MIFLACTAKVIINKEADRNNWYSLLQMTARNTLQLGFEINFGSLSKWPYFSDGFSDGNKAKTKLSLLKFDSA